MEFYNLDRTFNSTVLCSSNGPIAMDSIFVGNYNDFDRWIGMDKEKKRLNPLLTKHIFSVL